MTTVLAQMDALSEDEHDVGNLSTMMKNQISISNHHTLLFGDCFEKMNELELGSIDCVINDPPYGGITVNKWDKQLDLKKMWECYLRVLKPSGTVIMFCCSSFRGVPEGEDPFTTKLMNSRPKGWRFYTLVFEKHKNSSAFGKETRPLQWHEDIIVFYRPGGHTYNPQMRKPTKNHKNMGHGDEATMYPKSTLPVFVPERVANSNSTNKPIGTMEWLVKTFTDEYNTVLDNTMGSGSTGVACANTHRNFVGIEADPEQFPQTEHRIQKAYKRILREALDEGVAEPVMNIELPERRPRFDVDDYSKFYEKVSQLSDYDLMVSWIVKYINQYFCVVIEGNEIIESVYGDVEEQPMISCTPLMEEEKEKIKWALSYTKRSTTDLKLRFRKCTFHAENGKKADLYDAWSRSKESREYEMKVFDPMKEIAYDDKNILNTFAGLKAEQEVVLDQNNTSMTVDVEDLSIILLHIKNLCGGNSYYFEYLLDWLAYPIQTGQKTNVAVISNGGQGCGKSAFFVHFMAEQIYGHHLSSHIAGGHQIGDFNAHISGKMYLAIEEPNDFSKAKRNLLKDLITTGIVEVKTKNKDGHFQRDFTNYVFTCNKIPDDMLEDDDRRYFIIQHNGENDDMEFKKELAFCMETQVHEFYKFLRVRDIQHFEFGDKPPQTEVKKRLLTMAIDPIFKYLQHIADSDALDYYYKRPSDGSPVLPYRVFINNAKTWCEEEGESPSWKRKPTEMKEIMQSKLGQDECCFEPVQVKIMDNETGKLENKRCVLFPKTTDALRDLLVKKKVYTSYEEEEELKDFEDEFDIELKKAQVVELQYMKQREQQNMNRDRFDSQ